MLKSNQVFPLIFLAITLASARVMAQRHDDEVVKRLLDVSSESQLHLVDTIPLKFPTYHTQGLTRAGSSYFLTAVDVKRWPRKYPELVNGMDRDTGEGTGRIFRFSQLGELTGEVVLGEGSIYHPGGIDFDGQFIWIPVCEYRPNGRSIIYRLDPHSMKVEKMWTCEDALGAVICTDKQEIIGMNWDSEKFYKWKFDPKRPKYIHQAEVTKNNLHTFHIQDGQYVGNSLVLCSGLNRWRNTEHDFVLGGLQLLGTGNYQAVFQIPLTLRTRRGVLVCSNPFFAEVIDGKLRLLFAPEDDTTTLYVYEIQ